MLFNAVNITCKAREIGPLCGIITALNQRSDFKNFPRTPPG